MTTQNFNTSSNKVNELTKIMHYITDSKENQQQKWHVVRDGNTLAPFVHLTKEQAICAAALLNTGATEEFAREALGFNR